MAEFIIESVPHRKQAAAVRFIVGGERRDTLLDAKARVLRDSTLTAAPARATLWWARRHWRPVAAAMIVENPGRTAMLFASSVAEPGVDAAALAALVYDLCAHGIWHGLSMVQTLLALQKTADASVLRDAGFVDLAELIYMRRPLNVAPPLASGPPIEWRDYSQYDERELGGVISRTYCDSLDCPALAGVREIDDVIAGHKSCGVFSPDCWWIATVDGAPAGCVLVNDVPSSVTADVVYMGVVPEFRRQGVARAMLDHAAAAVRDRGVIAMSLAVDSGNMPARHLYEAAGFREIERRTALAMLAPRPHEPEQPYRSSAARTE